MWERSDRLVRVCCLFLFDAPSVVFLACPRARMHTYVHILTHTNIPTYPPANMRRVLGRIAAAEGMSGAVADIEAAVAKSKVRLCVCMYVCVGVGGEGGLSVCVHPFLLPWYVCV